MKIAILSVVTQPSLNVSNEYVWLMKAIELKYIYFVLSFVSQKLILNQTKNKYLFIVPIMTLTSINIQCNEFHKISE